MRIPNGSQLHEINKMIGTVTTLAIVGSLVYSEYQSKKADREKRARRDKLVLIDCALDQQDRDKFNEITKDL